jgi:CRP-like cAMP-binding protein
VVDEGVRVKRPGFGDQPGAGGVSSGANRVTERGFDPRSQVSPREIANLKPKFFRGLSPPEQRTVLAAGSYREFPQASVASYQGYPAEQLFLLIKGSARYFFITPQGQQTYLLWLKPGEIFGAASLLTEPSAYLVSTEVAPQSHVFVWQRNIIRRLAQTYPELLENSLSVANDYLVWYLASHLSLICHTAQQRLAHVLVSLATGVGQRSAGGVHLDITNEQLANTANITVFTASRFLSEWQRSGAIKKTKGHIVLMQPERLLSGTLDPAH